MSCGGGRGSFCDLRGSGFLIGKEREKGKLGGGGVWSRRFGALGGFLLNKVGRGAVGNMGRRAVERRIVLRAEKMMMVRVRRARDGKIMTWNFFLSVYFFQIVSDANRKGEGRVLAYMHMAGGVCVFF